MAAYLLVTITLQDDQAWREAYQKAVPAIIESFGGEYCVRSGGHEVALLEGDGPNPDRVALLRFPSMEAARGFANSEAYRPFKEARMAASSATMIAFGSDD